MILSIKFKMVASRKPKWYKIKFNISPKLTAMSSLIKVKMIVEKILGSL